MGYVGGFNGRIKVNGTEVDIAFVHMPNAGTSNTFTLHMLIVKSLSEDDAITATVQMVTESGLTNPNADFSDGELTAIKLADVAA